MHSPISENTWDVQVLSKTSRLGGREDGGGGGGGTARGKEPKTATRGRGSEVTSAGRGGSTSEGPSDGGGGSAASAVGGGLGGKRSGSGWGWGGYDGGYAALFGRVLDSGDGEQRAEGRSGGHAGKGSARLAGGGVVDGKIEIFSSDDEVVVLGTS